MGRRYRVHFQFLRPACVSLSGDILKGTYLTDGQTAWHIDRQLKAYKRIEPNEVYAIAAVVPGFNFLIQPSVVDYRKVYEESGAPVFSQGRWMGQDVYEAAYPAPSRGRADLPLILLIDRATWLPIGMRRSRPEGTKDEIYRYVDVKLDSPLDLAAFQFAPTNGWLEQSDPRNATKRGAPSGVSSESCEVKPGLWVGVGSAAIKVGSHPRLVSGNWVIDVESSRPGYYDLLNAKASVRIGREWRIATPVKKGSRILITAPSNGTRTSPSELRIDTFLVDSRAATLIAKWKT